jgi:F-type H+-transporting ATPase subunit beta
VLSRKRASEGLYPAIDLLQSNSKMATPSIVGERHYLLAQQIRRTLAQYQDLKDIIAMLGLEQLAPEDRKVVARARRLERFLTQPFFATEQFSGIKGKLVSIKDSLDGCERILRDEFKDYPESALYMIGAIDEAKEKVKAGKPVDKAKRDSKAGAKNDPKPVAETKPKPEPEPQPKSEPKPKPEAEHAAADAHES